MKYAVQCPVCVKEIPLRGISEAMKGMKCRECGATFVPKEVHQVELNIEQLGQIKYQELREYEQLRQEAGWCGTAAVIFAVISGVFIMIAFANNNAQIFFTISGAAFSLCCLCFILSQCFHIRAGLQKLFTKE